MYRCIGGGLGNDIMGRMTARGPSYLVLSAHALALRFLVSEAKPTGQSRAKQRKSRAEQGFFICSAHLSLSLSAFISSISFSDRSRGHGGPAGGAGGGAEDGRATGAVAPAAEHGCKGSPPLFLHLLLPLLLVSRVFFFLLPYLFVFLLAPMLRF